jgi:hypothetical protein
LKLEGFATTALKKAKEQRARSLSLSLSLSRPTHTALSNGAANFFHISFHPLVQPLVVCALSLAFSLLTLLKKLFIPVRHGRSHSLKASVNTFLMFAIGNGSHRMAHAAPCTVSPIHMPYFLYVCGSQSSARRIKIIALGLLNLAQLPLTKFVFSS